ncbi:DNA primase, partial [Pseudoflavonifractor sp. 60]|nr:DNA primase [Pseudoflavonifractor sp. 60]
DTPITGGTIVKMAMEGGWRPSPGQELGWEDPIGSVVDLNWLEGQEVQPPSDWDPVKQLITYLETLFEAGENVGYVTQTWEQEGKF